MSSRATPRRPANSGAQTGAGAWPLRTGVEPQPRNDPAARTPPARRKPRRVSVVMTPTLHSGHRFSSQFERPVDVLVGVGRADRSLLRRQREVIDPLVDELATVPPV